MPSKSAKEIQKRFSTAKARKGLWESYLRDAYRYSLPDKQTIDTWSPGQKKNQYVFDSTATIALNKYANRMQHQVVPPWKTWMRLEPGSDTPVEAKAEAQKLLDEATEVIFDHINHSNFSTQVHESFMDLGISTGAMIVEEGDGIQSMLNFRSVSLSEIYPEVTQRGTIENVFRRFKLPVRDIMEVWPGAELTQELNNMLKSKPEHEIDLIESVIKEGNQFETYVIYEDDVVFEEYNDTSPWVVFRESVTPGETLGRGRIMQLLPDIKTLNKIVEFNLRNAALAVSGVYTAIDDGVINPYSIKIAPGAIIPVSEQGALAPLATSGEFNLAQLLIQDYRSIINEFMFAQPFGNIQDTPVRTATEMGIRSQDLAQTSQASFGRMQSELLEPMIKRIVDILVKNGKLPPLRIDGREVTIKFTSPMAKTQDLEELQTFQMYMQSMQQLPPDYYEGAIKLEDIPQWTAEKMGIPQKLLRTPAEMEQMKQQMAAVQAQQQGGDIG
jgi:hypothetical protein